MNLHAPGVLLIVLMGVWAEPQGPKQPVWVTQAPPFGTIATLAGFPDLPFLRPVAGLLVTDIRISEWSPLTMLPSRFLRATQVDDVFTAVLLQWWIGNLGPYEPPASAAVRCTTPTEGPRTCIELVSLKERDWKAVVQLMLSAKECSAQRPTDRFELRLQVFERLPYIRYREAQVCDPLATEFRELMDALSPRVFARQK